ncbi:hypothetical protein SAMN03159422_01921 [Agrobacterium fabrum]|nr:hypothetical protein SAMN03159422_01921 [Agrobacterium fabrum]SER01122.1 hypothetical protein SAMN03159504_01921 [Agrobacterium fabrum]
MLPAASYSYSLPSASTRQAIMISSISRPSCKIPPGTHPICEKSCPFIKAGSGGVFSAHCKLDLADAVVACKRLHGLQKRTGNAGSPCFGPHVNHDQRRPVSHLARTLAHQSHDPHGRIIPERREHIILGQPRPPFVCRQLLPVGCRARIGRRFGPESFEPHRAEDVHILLRQPPYSCFIHLELRLSSAICIERCPNSIADLQHRRNSHHQCSNRRDHGIWMSGGTRKLIIMGRGR